ncbi:MAG: adenosylcobinamide-GDP ribazoletransferase [Victivallales bacterium]|nr:adenosylcobinamide-GDP ribazoletransferase [Victivallales bacterium]
MSKSGKTNSLWQGIWLCMSLMFKNHPSEDSFSDGSRNVALAFFPVRGIVIGLVAVIPFVIIGHVSRVDVFYLQLLVPFIYWGVIEKLTSHRRLYDFCKCSEAAADPDHAERIMHTSGHVPMTAAGAAGLITLAGGKLIVLYLLVTKNVISSENPNDFQFIIMLCSIPVLAEFGCAILASGDDKFDAEAEVNSKPFWPLMVAFLFTLPAGLALWLLASPNSLIMPLSLVLVMVFYWKRKADTVLGGTSAPVRHACYETCELAAAIGMLIVFQMPLRQAVQNIRELLPFTL